MAATIAPSCSGVIETLSPNEHMRPTPPMRGGQFGVGVDAELFAGDVVAGEFAEAELIRVVLHALKAESAAESLKVEIVGVRERLGERQGSSGRRG